MDHNPSGPSGHEILQVRILEWDAMPSSTGSSQSRDQNCIACISCIAGGFFPLSHQGRSPHLLLPVQFSSVQSLSCVQLFATPRIAARQSSLSITNSQSSLRFTSIKSAMPSTHLIPCHPLLLLPPIPPSIKVFSNESTLHEVAKVLEFQLYHQSFQ